MANHEVTYKCVRCGNEYDARLHGAACPECKTPSSTPAYRRGPSTGALFHIPDAALVGAGFTKTTFNYSDGGGFSNIREEVFTRQLADGLALEVSFVYKKWDGITSELVATRVDLVVSQRLVPMKLSSLAEIIRFTDTMVKSINTKLYAARCC